jgi:putative inorganic carbon (HCO3(-)) transporter
MSTPEKLLQLLFWLLVLQCCVISISIAAASVLLAFSLTTMLALVILRKQWIVPPTPLDAAFIAYITIEIVTMLLSVHQMDALKNMKRLLLIAIVYGVLASCKSREKIVTAVRLIAVIVGILSLVEIVLYVHNGNSRLFLFQHYMTTGGLKMIVALMLIPFVLSPELKFWERSFFGVSLLPIILALVLTNTRSAWLGFIAGILVMSFMKYRKLLYALIAVIILFFLVAPQNQIDRAKSIVDPTHPNNIGRIMMWKTGMAMWKDRPIFGFGDIDLYSTYSLYRTPGVDEPAGHLHNIYIHLLVTLGAVGFVIVMFLFYRIGKEELTIYTHHKDDALVRSVSLGSTAIFSGFLVNGIFEWNFGDHEIMVFLWFTVGLCLASKNLATIERV